MYFPPAAFDPGPAATVIGFALLLFLLAVPYAVSALPRIAPVFTRPSGLVALTLLLSAVEVAAVIAFHATAVHGLTLRDLVPGGFQETAPEWRILVGEEPPLWLVSGAVAALFATFVVWAVRERARVPEPRHTPLARWSGGEMLLYRASLPLGLSCGVAAYYLVLYPLLAAHFGPLTGVLVVALVSGCQYRTSGPAAMLWCCVIEAGLLGLYAFVLPGGLAAPLLLWSLFGVVLGRMAARQRLGELGDPVLEVTVLDADGAPVPRRED
ncbi:hypothetical protein ABZ249_18855 [Nocardiopsis sp. NPDC006139]|uniref:hypothetical protein n=1 Tax=Nocardiopsis sp. NPDC006139 TaxID=3154578 RepID=UPI0033B3579D